MDIDTEDEYDSLSSRELMQRMHTELRMNNLFLTLQWVQADIARMRPEDSGDMDYDVLVLEKQETALEEALNPFICALLDDIAPNAEREAELEVGNE